MLKVAKSQKVYSDWSYIQKNHKINVQQSNLADSDLIAFIWSGAK